MEKRYEYFIDGLYQTEGTIKVLQTHTGYSASHLRQLARYGSYDAFQDDVLSGKIKRYLLEIESEPQEYLLYAGDKIIAQGTIEEIAEDTGLKIGTVRWYGRPTAMRRGDKVLVKM